MTGCHKGWGSEGLAGSSKESHGGDCRCCEFDHFVVDFFVELDKKRVGDFMSFSFLSIGATLTITRYRFDFD